MELFERIHEAWHDRQNRLQGLYTKLGKEDTPGFADLTEKYNKLRKQEESLDTQWKSEEELWAISREKGKFPIRRIPAVVKLATVGNIISFWTKRSENRLGAVYGRRLRREINGLEKSLK